MPLPRSDADGFACHPSRRLGSSGVLHGLVARNDPLDFAERERRDRLTSTAAEFGSADRRDDP
jgi:hypothetical protein